MRILVKWGGSLQEHGEGLADDIAALWRMHELTIVHGGSRDIDDTMSELRLPHRTLRSPDGMETRYTDQETLTALMMAMRGRTQARLVSALAARGVPAVGLCGMDGGLVRTQRKAAVRAVVGDRVHVVRDNLAGRIVEVDPCILAAVHAAGMVPLLCPPGITTDGQATNVNADRMACEIAAAWLADRLVLLTDTDGILARPADPSSTISTLSQEDAQHLVPRLSGGMRMKVAASVEALEKGARTVQICDGRVASPLTDALRGSGTLIGKGLG